jgi:hypothetical protein
MGETLATVTEALRFYGLDNDVEELERMVVDYGIDADFDGDGRLMAVDVEGPEAREALFGEHQRKTGFRPDDPDEHRKALAAMAGQRKAAKTRRMKKRGKLERRVAARKGQTKKRRWLRRAGS